MQHRAGRDVDDLDQMSRALHRHPRQFVVAQHQAASTTGSEPIVPGRGRAGHPVRGMPGTWRDDYGLVGGQTFHEEW